MQVYNFVKRINGKWECGYKMLPIKQKRNWKDVYNI
jgi:hypothetical protein